MLCFDAKIKRAIGQEAFSLLEVVIAIGIISVGMLGVSSLMVQNLQAENIDQKILAASMLAQEGLELVRNQRDKNWLTDGADWADWVAGNGGGDRTYAIDYYPGEEEINFYYTGFDNINDARLQIDQFGFFAHDTGVHDPSASWTDSEFYRLINVTDHADYIEIKCTVRFYRLGKAYDYIAITNLYPWRY